MMTQGSCESVNMAVVYCDIFVYYAGWGACGIEVQV